MNFNAINPRDIVLIDFPYEDDPRQSKIRPAVVISKDNNSLEILIIKITSHPSRTEYDYQIVEWVKANLKVPSTARCNKSLVILPSQIIRKIGMLEMSDFQAVLQILTYSE